MRYEVEWERPGEGEPHRVCHGLDSRTLTARLIKHVKLSTLVIFAIRPCDHPTTREVL